MIKTKIITTRLKLRLIKASDLESIHNLHSLPETDRYNTLGIPKFRANTIHHQSLDERTRILNKKKITPLQLTQIWRRHSLVCLD